MGMIVNCAAYENGQRTADIDISEVGKYANRENCFVWVGLHEPDEALLKQVQNQLGLHDLAVEDAHRAHQRPKVEEYGESLFVVLRTAQLVDGDVALGETHVFLGKNYIVSVRHGASLSYADVRTRCERCPELLKKGTGFVLYAIMDFIVDNYFPIISGLEDELEKIEEDVFRSKYTRDTTERIYNLKRDLMALKKAVAPLVEMCNHLIRYDAALIPEDIRPYFRDVYDHVAHINEASDNVRDMLTTALQANLSLISVAQNEVGKKLAGWGAILAVPTMVAGIYGMNFKHMPELEWRYGYPVTIIGIAIVCGYLYYRFRKSEWL